MGGKGSGGYPKIDPQKEAEALMAFIEKEDSINLKDFCFEQKHLPAELSRLAKEDSNFAQVLQLAKLKLASRREKLAGKKDGIDASIVRMTHPLHDPELREWILEKKRTERGGTRDDPYVIKLIKHVID